MPDLKELETQRIQLYQDLSKVGDFRRGSIVVNYRRCGKPNCACTNPEHPGHGPQYLLTTKVNGKTQTKNLKPGSQMNKVEQEINNHQCFEDLTHKLIEVNERICELRPEIDCNSTSSNAEAEATVKKGAQKEHRSGNRR